jgi:ubiquinone/menaquinone biosynthesis C-methylase UbiE
VDLIWLVVPSVTVVPLLIVVAGSFRLNISRRVSLQGIEDSRAAEAYDRISRTPQFELIRRSFVNKLKKHAPKGTIADVGCGPGYLLQAIAREPPNNTLVGIDISAKMVERARTKLASTGHGERTEFRQRSADKLPFQDDTLDFVVGTVSLHHWADPQASFEEIHRVLKPGGQMLILDFTYSKTQFFLIKLFESFFVIIIHWVPFDCVLQSLYCTIQRF